MTNAVLDAALTYAAHGWHLFPVVGKQPQVEWRKRSTVDPDQLTTWFTPDAVGIGVDCGKSGLVVIDVDDWEGFADLDARMPDGWLDTRTAETGRADGGMHLYYRAPADTPIRNSASKIATGIDVRADGGYVVAPPSPHPDGQQYAWKNDLRTAPLPDELRLLLATPAPTTGPAPAAPPAGDRAGWGEAVLQGEAGRIVMAPVGTRNHTLYLASLKVYSAVKGGHLDRARADHVLTDTAVRAGLEAWEVARTLDSAWTAALERHPEERDRPVGTAIDPVRHAPPAGTAMDVLDLDGLDSLPPARWLLRDRLPEGMTVMFGPPEAGKTFVALDWALLVASLQPRPVLYLPGEGLSGLRGRIQAWRAKHPALDPSGFRVAKGLPNLLDPQQVADLDATCGATGAVLVIVDTFARALVGGDENSASDVGRAIRALDGLRERHGTSSLVLHHSGKGDPRVERGSGALRGAADAMWRIAREQDQPANIRVICDKLKDGAHPTSVTQQMVVDTAANSVALHYSTAELLGLQKGGQR